MRIKIRFPLIYNVSEEPSVLIDPNQADMIATRNAHPYAESFVKEYDGQTLTLDDNLKIRPDTVITIDEQIACVAREIAIRERCYPAWVKKKTMKQFDADKELNRMRAVIETLSEVKSGILQRIST